MSLWQIISITCIETFKEAQAFLVAALGTLGYLHGSRTYLNSIAPLVLPSKIDIRERKIKIKNIGRGPAQNIHITGYSFLINVGQRLVDWRLQLDAPSFLSPGDEVDLRIRGFENENEVSNPDLMFLNSFPSGTSPFYRGKGAPFFLSYENVEGTAYTTGAVIYKAEVLMPRSRRDYFYRPWIRYLSSKVGRGWIKFKWWYDTKTQKQGASSAG